MCAWCDSSRGLAINALVELRFEQLGHVVLAYLKGEVDLSNAQSVKTELLAAVPNTASALLVDLSDTRHLDSSGLQLLFELAHRLGNRGQELNVIVPDGSLVRRILVLTEIHEVVPLFTSIDAALG
jgi:anti-anti-sigma factor